MDCRVYMNGQYVDPRSFAGPEPEEERLARRKTTHRNTLAHIARQAGQGAQGSCGRLTTNPRDAKHRGYAVEGVRVK